jgi:leader peptidase (prepilin peptidase) / N-methyltransferase
LLLAIAAGLCGLAVGSMLGAMAARWPRLDRHFVFGRSRCATCGATLGAAELVPLWSWLRQAGCCRHCGARIGWLPLLAEVTGGGVALLAFATLAAPSAALLTAVGWWLLLLALVDVEHGRLPDVLTLPLLLAGIAAAARLPVPGLVGLGASGLGAALGFLLFAAVGRLYLAWRGRVGLGGGDAKLLAALGAWLGLEGVAPGVLAAALLGLGFALLSGSRRAEDALAFGPWLAIAGGGLFWWQLWAAS